MVAMVPSKRISICALTVMSLGSLASVPPAHSQTSDYPQYFCEGKPLAFSVFPPCPADKLFTVRKGPAEYAPNTGLLVRDGVILTTAIPHCKDSGWYIVVLQGGTNMCVTGELREPAR